MDDREVIHLSVLLACLDQGPDMGLVDIGDKIKDKDQRDQEEKGDNYSYLFDEAIPGHTSAHV